MMSSGSGLFLTLVTSLRFSWVEIGRFFNENRALLTVGVKYAVSWHEVLRGTAALWEIKKPVELEAVMSCTGYKKGIFTSAASGCFSYAIINKVPHL